MLALSPVFRIRSSRPVSLLQLVTRDEITSGLCQTCDGRLVSLLWGGVGFQCQICMQLGFTVLQAFINSRGYKGLYVTPGNTLRLHYKDQPVDAVEENTRSLLGIPLHRCDL